MKVRSARDRFRTADSTPLSTPSTTQMMAAPMTRDTVIGTAAFSTEFTDWPW